MGNFVNALHSQMAIRSSGTGPLLLDMITPLLLADTELFVIVRKSLQHTLCTLTLCDILQQMLRILLRTTISSPGAKIQEYKRNIHMPFTPYLKHRVTHNFKLFNNGNTNRLQTGLC